MKKLQLTHLNGQYQAGKWNSGLKTKHLLSHKKLFGPFFRLGARCKETCAWKFRVCKQSSLLLFPRSLMTAYLWLKNSKKFRTTISLLWQQTQWIIEQEMLLACAKVVVTFFVAKNNEWLTTLCVSYHKCFILWLPAISTNEYMTFAKSNFTQQFFYGLWHTLLWH